MFPFILSVLFSLAQAPSKPVPPLTLREALTQGYIQVEVTGTGGHTAESLQLKIRNQHRRAIELRIPAGQQFHSEDSTLQDLIVVRAKTIQLAKDEVRTSLIMGMCTKAGHGSPRKGTMFQTGEEAGGNLGKLVAYIDQQGITGYSAQYAIWVITNEESLGNIENEDLRRFTAELVGKTPPPYAIIRDNGQSAPGEPAFSSPPLAVQGTFTYQTDADIQASFGLYNDAGELVQGFFSDQPMRKGAHRFRFSFKIRGLPAGTYFARLSSKEKMIEQLKVEW